MTTDKQSYETIHSYLKAAGWREDKNATTCWCWVHKTAPGAHYRFLDAYDVAKSMARTKPTTK